MTRSVIKRESEVIGVKGVGANYLASAMCVRHVVSIPATRNGGFFIIYGIITVSKNG